MSLFRCVAHLSRPQFLFNHEDYKPKTAGSYDVPKALTIEEPHGGDRSMSKIDLLKSIARYHPDKNMKWRPDPESPLEADDPDARYSVLCEEVSILEGYDSLRSLVTDTFLRRSPRSWSGSTAQRSTSVNDARLSPVAVTGQLVLPTSRGGLQHLKESMITRRPLSMSFWLKTQFTTYARRELHSMDHESCVSIEGSSASTGRSQTTTAECGTCASVNSRVVKACSRPTDCEVRGGLRARSPSSIHCAKGLAIERRRWQPDTARVG
jgi:hypothetical protein